MKSIEQVIERLRQLQEQPETPKNRVQAETLKQFILQSGPMLEGVWRPKYSVDELEDWINRINIILSKRPSAAHRFALQTERSEILWALGRTEGGLNANS